MVGLAVVNFFLCYLLEDYVLESNFFQQKCQKSLEMRRDRKNLKYLRVEQEICDSPNWPPVSQTSQSLAEIMQLESSVPHNIPDSAVPQYTDDDEGDDDFMSDASHSNTPARSHRNIFRSHSGRSRRRTKSTTSSGSRYSSHAAEITPDAMHPPHKVTLSDNNASTDTNNVQNGPITDMPRSPTSPTLPLLDNQFVVPGSDAPNTLVTEGEVNIAGGCIERCYLPKETCL
ncbi:hypothetical protein LSH36_487g00007 [Paralvinella palmiformis]|uniref:Uncharacterized protein n=1 Tax=Paralvinella palmiformis TaxID=53620 RepID=A0AAD9J8Z2_9ANNE|nr:hypothetical protein LSH36_487g00007 [Paralvinella palmiformis]